MHKLTLTEIAQKIKTKQVSSYEAVKACLDAIEKNSHLNALNYVCGEQALERAAQIDQLIAKGKDAGLLGGVPLVVKDNINVEGLKTTCSSKALESFTALNNATVTQKILEQGAVIVGKANMDEFAMGSSNESSYFGAVKNPVAPEYIPGGSSGGSAAAVAAGLCYGALGSDTGGPIRHPAALCGVVGVKPTYGTVSRSGVVAFASSLDQVGPLTKTVEDSALLLKVISGYDEREQTSIKAAAYPSYGIDGKFSLKGLKVGVPKELMSGLKNSCVKEAFAASVDRFIKEGAEVIELSMAPLMYAIPAYRVLTSAEAASNLARLDGIKYGYRSEQFDDIASLYYKSRTEGLGQGVKRRIMLGNYVLNSKNYDKYYYKARQAQALIKQSYADAYNKCGLIMTPTTPTPAAKLGERPDDVLYGYPGDIFAASVNLAGNTAISIPNGTSKEGLPLGLQLIAPAMGEDLMLNAAFYYQEMR